MGFTQVSNETMNINMSDGAFRLYCMLQSYCFGSKDICFPSQKVLADRLRRSVRTIQRYIKELAELGLIQVIRRGSNNNFYKILDKVTKKAFETVEKTVKTITKKCMENGKKAKGNFNNFKQRNYDMNKLENMILGYDKNLSYEDCLFDK